MDNDQLMRFSMLVADATEAEPSPVVSLRSCSGGCIHVAQIATLKDGREYFVKSGPNAGNMFAQEAFGLDALRQSGCLRTPTVVAAGMLDDSHACLILEAIPTGTPDQEFWEHFGQQFALLHREAQAQSFGWSSDNYLGSSMQKNAAHHEWIPFFAECRLGYQVRLARNHSHGSIELYKRMDRLISRLDKILGDCNDPPSLLHGDLWSGNYLVDATGRPVIVDPAVYYGQREADLAMPMLFGGFDDAFFDAYQQAWPLDEGWRERIEIYQLYHLLNHLNMFGSGYLDSCLEIARKFA